MFSSVMEEMFETHRVAGAASIVFAAEASKNKEVWMALCAQKLITASDPLIDIGIESAKYLDDKNPGVSAGGSTGARESAILLNKLRGPLEATGMVVDEYDERMVDYFTDIRNSDRKELQQIWNTIKDTITRILANPSKFAREQVQTLTTFTRSTDYVPLPNRATNYMVQGLQEIPDPENMNVYLTSCMVMLGGAKAAEQLFKPYIGQIDVTKMKDPIKFLLDGSSRDAYYQKYGDIGAIPGMEETVTNLVRMQDTKRGFQPVPDLDILFNSSEPELTCGMLVVSSMYPLVQTMYALYENSEQRREAWSALLKSISAAMSLMGFYKPPFFIGNDFYEDDNILDIVTFEEAVKKDQPDDSSSESDELDTIDPMEMDAGVYRIGENGPNDDDDEPDNQPTPEEVRGWLATIAQFFTESPWAPLVAAGVVTLFLLVLDPMGAGFTANVFAANYRAIFVSGNEFIPLVPVSVSTFLLLSAIRNVIVQLVAWYTTQRVDELQRSLTVAVAAIEDIEQRERVLKAAKVSENAILKDFSKTVDKWAEQVGKIAAEVPNTEVYNGLRVLAGPFAALVPTQTVLNAGTVILRKFFSFITSIGLRALLAGFAPQANLAYTAYSSGFNLSRMTSSIVFDQVSRNILDNYLISVIQLGLTGGLLFNSISNFFAEARVRNNLYGAQVLPATFFSMLDFVAAFFFFNTFSFSQGGANALKEIENVKFYQQKAWWDPSLESLFPSAVALGGNIAVAIAVYKLASVNQQLSNARQEADNIIQGSSEGQGSSSDPPAPPTSPPPVDKGKGKEEVDDPETPGQGTSEPGQLERDNKTWQIIENITDRQRTQLAANIEERINNFKVIVGNIRDKFSDVGVVAGDLERLETGLNDVTEMLETLNGNFRENEATILRNLAVLEAHVNLFVITNVLTIILMNTDFDELLKVLTEIDYGNIPTYERWSDFERENLTEIEELITTAYKQQVPDDDGQFVSLQKKLAFIVDYAAKQYDEE